MTKYKYRATHKTTGARAMGAAAFDSATMAEIQVAQLKEKHPHLFVDYRFDVVPVYVAAAENGKCATCAYRSYREGALVCVLTSTYMGRRDSCPSWEG